MGGSIAKQTHKMIQNAAHVLDAAGSELGKTVQVNVSGLSSDIPDSFGLLQKIFLKDYSTIGEVNDVYADYFPQRPARTTCEVTKMPAGAEIMMDLVAVV